MEQRNIIFVVGPTAVGKSAVSVDLALALNGEIVSCDSMQVYKEVNIASNMPSREMRRAIVHHLIGIISVKEEFDVATFRRKAVAAIQKIHRKGKVPLVVGGSGLYMTVLLDGIFEGAAKDEQIRKQLKSRISREGVAALYQEFKRIDPLAAGKIHSNDERRIIRALEIHHITGQPILELQKKRSGLWSQYAIRIFVLNRDRRELYQLIDDRVDEMFRSGLVDEIRKIAALPLSQTAMKIIGIKEVSGYLKGDYDLAQAKVLMKKNTRHFAKRQLTWFRKDQRLEWIDVMKTESATKVAERIYRKIQHDG